MMKPAPSSNAAPQTSPNAPAAVSSDEAEVRRTLDAWRRSLERKDVDGLTADYAPDALGFDGIYAQLKGVEAYRKIWRQCLPHFPDSCKVEHRHEAIRVSGDLAVAHFWHHVSVPSQPDHPAAQTWLRVTVCYERIGGKWRVVHDHVSLPFNPLNGQATMIADPDTHKEIDFSACDPA